MTFTWWVIDVYRNGTPTVTWADQMRWIINAHEPKGTRHNLIVQAGKYFPLLAGWLVGWVHHQTNSTNQLKAMRTICVKFIFTQNWIFLLFSYNAFGAVRWTSKTFNNKKENKFQAHKPNIEVVALKGAGLFGKILVKTVPPWKIFGPKENNGFGWGGCRQPKQ